MSDQRRCALVRVSHSLMTECLLGNFQQVTTDAPPDMHVIGVGTSMPGAAGYVEFVVWSETFDPIPVGGAYPLKVFTYRKIGP